MSNKEYWAMKKSGKHQRVHKTLPSNDFKNSDEVNPGNNCYGAFGAVPHRGDTLLLGTGNMGAV